MRTKIKKSDTDIADRAFEEWLEEYLASLRRGLDAHLERLGEHRAVKRIDQPREHRRRRVRSS